MKLNTTVLSAALLWSGSGLALAAPGPEEACQALSERAREAAAQKKAGTPVGKAVDTLSALAVPDSVPAAQHDFYKAKLPGAIRFAYMAGMSGDGLVKFYLKQCLQGS
jgi:hypothetical protein